jgi:hypothetical protein
MQERMWVSALEWAWALESARGWGSALDPDLQGPVAPHRHNRWFRSGSCRHPRKDRVATGGAADRHAYDRIATEDDPRGIRRIACRLGEERRERYAVRSSHLEAECAVRRAGLRQHIVTAEHGHLGRRHITADKLERLPWSRARDDQRISRRALLDAVRADQDRRLPWRSAARGIVDAGDCDDLSERGCAARAQAQQEADAPDHAKMTHSFEPRQLVIVGERSRRIAMKTVMAGALMIATLSAAAEPVRRYDNVLYGFSLCYPATLSAGREADNSDGKSFTDHKGFNAAVWGENNINNIALSEAKVSEGLPEPRVAAKVTYDFQRGNVAVVSGISGSEIFFTKIIKRADQFLILALTYPKTRQLTYQQAVKTMSVCFKATA